MVVVVVGYFDGVVLTWYVSSPRLRRVRLCSFFDLGVGASQITQGVIIFKHVLQRIY